MDPFEVRMEFISLVSKLTSSVLSISKVASFALKHAAKCSDDIWDCYVDEIAHANLNARVNLLYLLDALLDKEGPKAVLRSWKTRRLLDADVLEQVTGELENRKAALHDASADSSALANFSKNDILRRIEDDRERHKRLKERIWVLPVPSTIFSIPLSSSIPAAAASSAATTSQKPSPVSPASPFEPASAPKPKSSHGRRSSMAAAAAEKAAPLSAVRGPELALEIEFEQLWEANEEERRAVHGGVEDDLEMADAMRPWKRSRVWVLDEHDRQELRRESLRCFVDDAV
ncbi:C-terminal domain kinase, subunit gamma, CTK3 [Rhodotorula toruloides]|uniref:C-terminal domain kinase, subunit gamma, CTK3 n=1 Tax=Rhodotorula toruloides TaxID=5286 RepID=A0A511K7H2_RHOTO|nr:C-terminal domain kinase, subunit gamma, CTK3 [Rhodotorula toruloides]